MKPFTSNETRYERRSLRWRPLRPPKYATEQMAGGGGDRRDDLPPQLAPVLRRLVHVHVHLRLVIIDDTDDKRARQSSVVLCLVGG